MKNIIKMLTVYSLIIASICITEIPVRAEDNEENIESTAEYNRFDSYEQYVNDPDYYDPVVSAKREASISKMQDVQAIHPMSVYSKQLSIPHYKQENSYYCAPTSVSIVLKFKTGTYYSQSSLAGSMGTNKGGTYVYQVVNQLNSVLGAGTYSSYPVNSASLENAVYTGVNADYPVICNPRSGKLEGYDDTDSAGHYAAAYKYQVGWSGTANYDYMWYFDSYDNGSGAYGNHKISFSDMEDAINENTGYFIAKS